MAGADDLLTPEEIDALMSAARGSTPDPAAAPAPSASPAAKPAAVPKPAAAPKAAAAAPAGVESGFAAAERSLGSVEQHLAAALAAEMPRGRALPPDADSASPYRFEDFERPPTAAAREEFPITALQDVELDLRIELGRTELLIEEILQLREGAVVPLDKLAGDPVDILVNGRLIARGEVLVLNDNFCVRVAEILAP